MFGMILTTVYTVMLPYILRRAGSVSSFTIRFSRNSVIWLGAILWFVFF
jgi:hypothetical protein